VFALPHLAVLYCWALIETVKLLQCSVEGPQGPKSSASFNETQTDFMQDGE